MRGIIGLPAPPTEEFPEEDIDEVNDFDEYEEPSRRVASAPGRSAPPKLPSADHTVVSPAASIASAAAAAAARPARASEPARISDSVASKAPEKPRSAHELVTLLLVEDEVLLLNYMRKKFNSAGFAVTSADSGSEAIQLLSGTDYDVVLADWYMPNGSGEELYNWIQLRRPELMNRCFFMSGAVGAEVHSEIAPTGCKVFPKGQDPEPMIQTLLSAGRDAKKHA